MAQMAQVAQMWYLDPRHAVSQKGACVFDMRHVVGVAQPTLAAVVLGRIGATWRDRTGTRPPVGGQRTARRRGRTVGIRCEGTREDENGDWRKSKILRLWLNLCDIDVRMYGRTECGKHTNGTEFVECTEGSFAECMANEVIGEMLGSKGLYGMYGQCTV